MSNPNVPVKTPLGHEELRRRTQRLGQRYRTVLLLVDGRRPLAEVLSMAHQAGAQSAHFEELLRLGMIELPLPPEPPQPPNDLPDVAPPMEGAATAALEPAASEAAPAVDGAVRDEVVAVDASATSKEPSAAPAFPPAVAATVPAVPVAAAPAATEERLDEARRLLVDTLRRDTLLQRVFAPARVRAAQSQEELIGLVWEIERERAHARRKRGQLLNLQRARELLGMGNTVVAEDSLPWRSPEEES